MVFLHLGWTAGDDYYHYFMQYMDRVCTEKSHGRSIQFNPIQRKILYPGTLLRTSLCKKSQEEMRLLQIKL